MDKTTKLDVKDARFLEPEKRLRKLLVEVEIDSNIPPKRYYRSGVEMLRMANVYLEEGSLEQAYILYMKFLILFMEKITKHPMYSTVTGKERSENLQKIKEVLPKAEALKKKLLEQYKVEYEKSLNEMKTRELEKERLKKLESQRLKGEEELKNKNFTITTRSQAKISAGAVINSKEPKPSLVTNIPITYPSLDDIAAPSAKESRSKTPSIDRSTKPATLASDKLAMRDLVLPSSLMKDFLKLAHGNTTSNKETCGILAGRLERNKLFITHLLIPKQTGSSDSCVTHNEEDFFDYQDQHDLITLGWIHTHPTQTAFLSSVDLHTHCAYQLMMAEAIAIVCAPKYDETGFFTLTSDYGLNYIANCRESGFHPHPSEPPLYMKAKHCVLDTTSVVVVDLRKK